MAGRNNFMLVKSQSIKNIACQKAGHCKSTKSVFI